MKREQNMERYHYQTRNKTGRIIKTEPAVNYPKQKVRKIKKSAIFATLAFLEIGTTALYQKFKSEEDHPVVTSQKIYDSKEEYIDDLKATAKDIQSAYKDLKELQDLTLEDIENATANYYAGENIYETEVTFNPEWEDFKEGPRRAAYERGRSKGLDHKKRWEQQLDNQNSNLDFFENPEAYLEDMIDVTTLYEGIWDLNEDSRSLNSLDYESNRSGGRSYGK